MELTSFLGDYGIGTQRDLTAGLRIGTTQAKEVMAVLQLEGYVERRRYDSQIYKAYNTAVRRFASLLVAVVTLAATAADIPITGTWVGQENELIAVELKLRGDHGQVSGTIAFYFQTRGQDGKWHLEGNPPFTVPLLSLKLDEMLLTFETIHHKQHGSPELGPNNRYRVVFDGPKEAFLQVFRGSEKQDDSRPALKLVRR